MKRIALIYFALIVLCPPPAYAQQRQLTHDDTKSERRVALVIGNSAYLAAPLKNPVNDAQDMARSLGELGFDVIHKENLNQNDMKRAIRAFGEKLRGGGVGLFYYAGHGVSVKGINYLVPVDAKVESEEEVEYECVDAGFLLAQMESAGNSMNIVILDACRNNPFARSFRSASRGLAQMDAPSGTLIAHATAPGSLANDGNSRNGLYTQELLKFLRVPSLGLENVFKQVRISVRNLTQGKQTPWESSSLIGDFYFTRFNEKAGSANPQPSISAVDPMTIELAYWETIKNSSYAQDFKSYLGRYPNGQFADLARNRLKSLEVTTKVPPELTSNSTQAGFGNLEGTSWVLKASNVVDGLEPYYYEYQFLSGGVFKQLIEWGEPIWRTGIWRQEGNTIYTTVYPGKGFDCKLINSVIVIKDGKLEGHLKMDNCKNNSPSWDFRGQKK